MRTLKSQHVLATAWDAAPPPPLQWVWWTGTGSGALHAHRSALLTLRAYLTATGHRHCCNLGMMLEPRPQCDPATSTSARTCRDGGILPNKKHSPLPVRPYCIARTIACLYISLATGIRRRKCFIRIQKWLLEFKSAWMQTVDVLDLDSMPLKTNISLNNI